MDFHRLARPKLQKMCKKNKLPANLTNAAMADALAMDFHRLARPYLQTMCKKNKILANLTNAAMADALQSLKYIEWDAEIKQKLTPQSETIEQHGSPLPRSRRVAAISSDISGFTMGEINDKDEEMKNQRIQSATSTRTRARTSTATAGTRTRKGKKGEAPGQAVNAVVVEIINQFLPVVEDENDDFDHDAPVRKFRTLQELYETTQVLLLWTPQLMKKQQKRKKRLPRKSSRLIVQWK